MTRPNQLHRLDEGRRAIVMLTGFGPFPGMPENVSSGLVTALAKDAARAFPDFDFRYEILATEWGTAPQRVAELIQTLKPVLSLHFGVAQSACDIRIETRAANLCHLANDAAGQLPLGSCVVAGGADLHTVTIPVSAVYQKLNAAGIPVSISDDAGGYLCNAVLYQSVLENTRQGAPKMSGFIHLPVDFESSPVSFPVALNACLLIIEACLAVQPV